MKCSICQQENKINVIKKVKKSKYILCTKCFDDVEKYTNEVKKMLGYEKLNKAIKGCDAENVNTK